MLMTIPECDKGGDNSVVMQECIGEGYPHYCRCHFHISLHLKVSIQLVPECGIYSFAPSFIALLLVS